jgi:predicted aldo/keto reductase-like oxidoreductase
MQYRTFGRLDWKVSALGFGAMRLPVIGNDQSTIDQPEAIKMIRYAIDHGVNYLDTGYPYHNGQSERVVGLALKDGYRQRMRLTTKLPARMVEKAEDFDRFFNEQLERLQVDKLDNYLLHGLNTQNWPKVRDLGVLRWAEKKMAQGRFDYIGFSFHDNFETFKSIVDAYDNWTLAQIQYNYVDVNNQAGRRGVEYAANKRLAIVVMEPIRGGRLSRKPPEKVAQTWGDALSRRSQAEWALSWVWNQPEISLALSGMSTMEQVVENVAVADRSGATMLTPSELALIDRVREAYKSSNPVPCTGCNYCQPCPNGVAIPAIFELYNEANVYAESRQGRANYQGMGPRGMKAEQRADNCVECGTCVEACPQQIDIPDWLKKAHAFLGPKPQS